MATENQLDQLTPAKRAVYEIRKLRARVEELERLQNEPVAIVGMGLRFPGNASTPEDFWKVLMERVDTVSEIPPSRWRIENYYNPNPDVPGKMYTRHGSFLGDPALFDAGFFGISPREATTLDPQHRLALEVAWEALENAGYNPAGFSHESAQASAGVFLAFGNSDYNRLAFHRTSEIDAYTSTGNLFSAAVGRISYTLGLHGPSVAVDTACSGSLVAVHLACQSLRTGECELALAGGVNLILSPEININFSKSRMLAVDGRCKTFDRAADGYGRGEGCGMIVLKRLSDAQANGDRILAVVRGSAVNQDGRSGGLTVPNGPAQMEVIRTALAHAKIPPERVGYVEAHGTGTALGDPIEAHALAAALGANRGVENPLVIGSVKTNVGHLEAAAGIAGLIKVVLALQHGEIPPNQHFHELNPHIDWSGMPVEIPVERRAWSPGLLPRVAGISSFGFSGTNAHAVLEEAPIAEVSRAACDRPLHILTLSGRSESALRRLSEAYAAELPRTSADLADICFTANAGRSHFQERAVYVGMSSEHLLRQTLFRGTAETEPDVAFLFPGHGAHYAGMGQELYETQPVYRSALDECAQHLAHRLETPLPALLQPADGSEAALFAVEYALARLWLSWGVRPSVVLGQGIGEYVAATVAGVWSLEDGVRLMFARSRQQSFAEVAAAIQYQQPQVPVGSIELGRIVKAEEIASAEYWTEAFTGALPPYGGGDVFSAAKCQVYLEVGPATTLVDLGSKSSGDAEAIWLPSIREGHEDWRQLLEALGRMYVAGMNVDWAGFDGPYKRRRVALPTYPFERRRYWLGEESDAMATNNQRAWGCALESAERQSRQCPLDLQIATYPDRWQVLDRLSLAYIVEAWRSLHIFEQAGERHSTVSMVREFGIAEVYRKLMARWLNRACAAGLLVREDDQFVALQPLPAHNIETLLAEADRSFGDDRIILDYVIRCGSRLPSILTGRLGSLETLFPRGSCEHAEDLYERAPLSQYFNSIARAAVEGFARPHDRGLLRVLELGAGTGATAAAVLPVLQPQNVQYTFTDVSQWFLDQASRKFVGYPFIRYRLFDMERSSAEQGFPGGQYDIVLATNAVHATRDIRKTVHNIRSLLSSGGILVLCEATAYLPWFDITTALIEGWQAFGDDLRHDHPLVSAEDWRQTLLATGFESCEAYPRSGSPAELLGQHVIVACAPRREGELSMPSELDAGWLGPQPVANPAELQPAAIPQNLDELVNLVRQQVSQLLAMDSAGEISKKRRLVDLGVDSLMAIELRDRLVAALGLTEPLPATLVFDYPTAEGIAIHLWHDVLHLGEESPAFNLPANPIAGRAEEIEKLGEDEVEALLRARLQLL